MGGQFNDDVGLYIYGIDKDTAKQNEAKWIM